MHAYLPQVNENICDIYCPTVKATVIQMLTKPMKLAEYFCSGACAYTPPPFFFSPPFGKDSPLSLYFPSPVTIRIAPLPLRANELRTLFQGRLRREFWTSSNHRPIHTLSLVQWSTSTWLRACARRWHSRKGRSPPTTGMVRIWQGVLLLKCPKRALSSLNCPIWSMFDSSVFGACRSRPIHIDA